MQELTVIRGTVRLEDTYCRIHGGYTAEREENDGWSIIFKRLEMKIINSSGSISQQVYLRPWQMGRAIELLEPQLKEEASKDIKRQLDIDEEARALGKAGL